MKNNRMNKTQLVAKFASLASIPNSRADLYLAAFLDAVEAGLRADGRVAIKDFGIFEVRLRRGRAFRHPRTGESVVAPNKKKVTFRSCLALRDRTANAPVEHIDEVTPV